MRLVPEFVNRAGNPYSFLRHCAIYEVSGKEVAVLASPDRAGVGRKWFQVDESREGQWFALLHSTVQEHDVPPGLYVINTSDTPLPGPAMSFCRERGTDVWLLPNYRLAYEDTPLGLSEIDGTSPWWGEVRRALLEHAARRPLAERNMTPFLNGNVNSQQRLEYVQAAAEMPSLFSARMLTGGVHGLCELEGRDDLLVRLQELGFAVSSPTPFTEHLDFAINVFAEGKVLADRMRLLVNTGAAVVGYRSRYEEYFSSELEAEDAVHWVESTPELVDLMRKGPSLDWLEERAGRARDFSLRHLRADRVRAATAQHLNDYARGVHKSLSRRTFLRALRELRRPFQMDGYFHKDLPSELM